MNKYNPFGKWEKFRKSLNTCKSLDPVIQHLENYKAIVQAIEKKLYTFVTALFIIFKEKEATVVSLGVN